MLRFIIPTGSLADSVRGILKPAGFDVPKSDRTGFCGEVNGVKFYQLDRRTIPHFLETNDFDAGITGRDLLIASGVLGLNEICTLQFSRSSDQPTRWVLAKRAGFEPTVGQEVRIGCELPRFAQEILQKKDLPFHYSVVSIYGSEEQCARLNVQGIAMVVVVTESGDSIRKNGLDVVPSCENLFESTPVIIARPLLDAEKEGQLRCLSAALRSALGARQKVMVVCDIPSSVDIQALALPSVIAPTVASLTEKDWYSCTICIPVSEQGRVLATLEDAGARGIVVIPVQGYLA